MTFNLNLINARFRKLGEFTLKWKWGFLVLLIMLDLIAVLGLQRVQLQSSWDSWFLDDDPIKRATDRFEEYFGNSDDAAILVEAPDVFAPHVLKMIRELGNDLEKEVPFVDKVTSLAEFEFSRGTESGMLVGNLVPDVIPTDPEEVETIRKLAFAKKNLVNKLFSDDSKQTWISIRLKTIPKDFGKKEGIEPLYVVGEGIHKVLSRKKYREFDLKETGMAVIAYDKTNFFTKEAARITMMALGAVVILLIFTLRSVRGVVVPIITMASSIMLSYGILGFLDIKIDTSAITIPLYLGLAISVGYSIHIINFFNRRFRETGKRKESVLYAVEHTGWPLFFTALTTIGCMLSFNLVDITTIRGVGNTSSAIIVVVYLFAMILTPILLSLGKDAPGRQRSSISKPVFTDVVFGGLGNWTLRNGKKIIALSMILFIFLGVGTTKVYVDFDVFNGFGLKIPYVKRLWDITQSKIGSLYSYNVLIELPEDDMAKDPAVLRKFEELDARIKHLALTKNTTSILEIIKDMNRTLHNGDNSYYRIPEDRDLVTQLLFLYEMSGGSESKQWLDVEDGYRMLRLNVSIKRFVATEVEKEMAEIEAIAAELFPDASFGMVGTFVEGAVIQNYIAKGQLSSFLIALMVIAVLMVIVFRSLKAGLIALIPNLTPVFVIGGIMGYLNIPLDMMTMTIVPMLMGIAVDDSIHFINHVKFEIGNSGNYDEGIQHTFKTVGKALFMTSFILIITFSTYMTSIAKFYVVLGILVILGLLSALLADYLITPVLIKWTRPFKREKILPTARKISVQTVG
ncbi:MAG: MMPL family transporter [Proteobacteria bacterium]|nr:MMPL family transporter [Pseudomonadota bacterium]